MNQYQEYQKRAEIFKQFEDHIKEFFKLVPGHTINKLLETKNFEILGTIVRQTLQEKVKTKYNFVLLNSTLSNSTSWIGTDRIVSRVKRFNSTKHIYIDSEDENILKKFNNNEFKFALQKYLKELFKSNDKTECENKIKDKDLLIKIGPTMIKTTRIRQFNEREKDFIVGIIGECYKIKFTDYYNNNSLGVKLEEIVTKNF